MDAARYAVIGDPVAHSLSPRLFGLLFEQLGLRASYAAERVTEDALPAFVARLRRGGLQGASVTLPHKVRAAELLDALDPSAQRTGAVNCIRAEGGGLVGHNTDVAGIALALERRPVKKAVVLGAGGAARAAVVALEELGAQEIVVANRTRARAEALAERFATVRVADVQEVRLDAVEVLINATSVGMARETPPPPLPQGGGDLDLTSRPAPLPWERGWGEVPNLTALDLVYRPLHTALLRQAQAAGARTIDGLWVLIFQALAQLQLWTGRTVDADTAARLHAALAPEAA